MMAAATAHAATDNCTPSKLMFVLDHSSSMNDAVDSTKVAKWTIAKDAVTTIANSYDKKIAMGLNVFPNPSECSPGTMLVKPEIDHATKIATNLPGAPPSSGNYTPMSQTIDVAVDDLLKTNPGPRPSIVLVTDGWQWCYPYDASTRLWPVDSVKKAAMKGVTVYVIGFGSEVDVYALNQMAVAAGTQLPGCDPTGDSASSANKCYYQADSGVMLGNALDSVAIKVSAEVCDGLDNDCDGVIDNGMTRSCANGCGGGTETCTNGVWGGCTAPAVGPELCDGKDNDCNGTIDEGCACLGGQVRACGSILGACALHRGSQTCGSDGKWGSCDGATLPSPEVCNGLDDDCDGLIDNGSPSALCPNGEVCGDDGHCHDPFQGTNNGNGPGGCGCDVGRASQPVPPAAIILMLIGVGALIASRRRTR
jgi:hypothetical protein